MQGVKKISLEPATRTLTQQVPFGTTPTKTNNICNRIVGAWIDVDAMPVEPATHHPQTSKLTSPPALQQPPPIFHAPTLSLTGDGKGLRINSVKRKNPLVHGGFSQAELTAVFGGEETVVAAAGGGGLKDIADDESFELYEEDPEQQHSSTAETRL